MTVAASALVRDLEDLHDRLQVAPPPRVARRVRALIHEALGLLIETPPRQTSSHTVRVPLTPERGACTRQLDRCSPRPTSPVGWASHAQPFITGARLCDCSPCTRINIRTCIPP